MAKPLRWVFFALLVTSAALAQGAADPLLIQVQTAGAQVAALLNAATETGRRDDAEAHRLALRLDALKALSRRAQGSELVESKLSALIEQLNALRRSADSSSEVVIGNQSDTPRRVGLLESQDSPDCFHARTLAVGEASEGVLAAGAQTWLRIESPTDALASLDTAGSLADTQLDVFADRCPGAGDAPVDSSDDSVGLAARLSLRLVSRHPLWVRLTNVGVAGAVQARLTANGFVSGHVLDSRTGAPIYGEVVAYYGNNSISAVTVNGGYSLSLPAGDYYLRARGSGTAYVSELYPDATCPDDYSVYLTCAMAQAQLVHVAVGEVTDNIDFHLGMGARLRGAVRDAQTGALLPYAGLSLFNSSGAFVQNESSDAQGRFDIGRLAPSTYYLSATAAGYGMQLYDGHNCLGPLQTTCYPLTATPITVVREEDRIGLDFTLQRMASIQGHATAEATDSGYCCELHVLDVTGAEVWTGYTTDGDGGYRAGPLALGSYYVYAAGPGHFSQLFDDVDCLSACRSLLSQATKVVLSSANATANADFHLTSYRGLSGRVTDAADAQGLASRIELREVNSSIPTSLVYADAHGDYRFPVVAPGDYFVIAHDSTHRDIAYPSTTCDSPNPYGTGHCDLTGVPPVHVGALQDVTNINFSLPRNASVSGHVQLRMPGSTFADLPVFGASVEIRALDTNQSWAWVSTDASGSYVANDLPANTYYAVVTSNFDRFGQTYAAIDCDTCTSAAGATPMALSMGQQRTGVNFDPIAKYLIVGRVTNALTGAAIPGVLLDMWYSDQSYAGSGSSGPNGFFSVAPSSISNEAFKLSTDAGNAYVNELYDNVPCRLGPVYYGKCGLEGGTTLSIPTLQMQPIVANIALLPASEIIFGQGFE